MRPKSTTDLTIGRIASRSHGVVTRAELLRAGITLAEIKWRLHAGVLLPEHRGVYRVGHRAPSVDARFLAAVRACGEGAALSGRAAGHLLGLVRGTAPPPEVTTPSKRRVAGLRIRRSQVMTTRWRGIPVTTVPQTLVDLAADLSLDGLARACHEAGVRYGTTPADVKAIAGKHAGAANLRAVLDGDVHVTLSKLEKRFLERLEQVGLPLPVTNRPAGTKRVDCRSGATRTTTSPRPAPSRSSGPSWSPPELSPDGGRSP